MTLLKQAPNDNLYKRDKETLNKLILAVDDKIRTGSFMTPGEFLNLLNENGHRILFYPFFTTFCYRSGSDFILYNAVNFTLSTKNGQDVIDLDKKKTQGNIIINLNELPSSYACPPLIKTSIDDLPGLFEAYDIQLPKGVTEDFKMLLIAFNEDSGKYLGMYGYLLQAPTVQIPNEWLRSVESVTERLQQLEPKVKVDETTGESYTIDPRFPKRSTWTEIPVRPVDFVPEDYTPLKLTESDYIIDTSSEFKKFVRYRKGKQVGYELQPVTKNGKTKWVEKKDKSGKKIPKYEQIFTGKYGKADDKGRVTNLTVYNNQGFEIRPGDYVQLWGDPTRSYYVETIDVTAKDGPMLHLTHYGDPNGRGGKSIMEKISNTTSGKRITIDAVTKVVKRTVIDKRHITDDIYMTGRFKVLPKYKQGKYVIVEKTLGTMNELIEAVKNGEDVPNLNFDTSWFYLVPTYKEHINDQRGLNTPKRQINGQQVEGYIIQSIEGLEEMSSKLSDPNIYPDVEGYTLFLVFRSDGYSPEQQVANTDLIDRMHTEIVQSAMMNKSSKWIAHQVIFDAEVAAALSKDLQPANVSDITYDPIEISRNLPRPEDHIVLNEDGTLNIEESAKFIPEGIVLTSKEHDSITASDIKYPERHWMYELHRDENNELTYQYFPRPWFLFAEGLKKVLNSEDRTLVTSDTYDLFIAQDNTVPGKIEEFWQRALRGYTFEDYQVFAYEPVGKLTAKNTPKSADDIRAEETLKNNQKSQLIRDRKNRSINNPIVRFVIQDIKWDNDKLWIYYVNSPNPGEELNVESPRKVELKEFIFFLGTRFLFIPNIPRINIGAPIISPVYNFATRTSSIEPTIITQEEPTSNLEDTPELDFSNKENRETNIKNILANELSINDSIILSQIIINLNKIYDISELLNESGKSIIFDKNLVMSLSEILKNTGYRKVINDLCKNYQESSNNERMKLHAILFAINKGISTDVITNIIKQINSKDILKKIMDSFEMNEDQLNC